MIRHTGIEPHLSLLCDHILKFVFTQNPVTVYGLAYGQRRSRDDISHQWSGFWAGH